MEQISGRLQLPESYHPDRRRVLIVFTKHRAQMDGESCPFHTLPRPDPEGNSPQPFLWGESVCVCAAVCSGLPSTPGSSCIPAFGTRGDATDSPWHVAVLGPVPAPGWDVPQVRVPKEWFFLGGCKRGAGAAFPFVCQRPGRRGGGGFRGVAGFEEQCPQEMGFVQRVRVGWAALSR